MRYRLLAIAGVILLLVCVATSVKAVVEQHRQSQEPKAVSAQRRAVTAVKVTYKSVQQKISADGAAFAWELVSVSPETSGLRIDDVLVHEGQHVKQGQLLVRMNDSVLAAELREAAAGVSQATSMVTQAEAKVRIARARCANAESVARRYKTLASNGAISEMDAQNAYTEATALAAELSRADNDVSVSRASVLAAQSRVERLQALLNQTKLSAPVAGLVVKSNAIRGEMAEVGKPLFSLARDSRLELRVKVPETQLLLIHPGQSVVVSSRVSSPTICNGRVRELVPSVDEVARLGTVRVDIPGRGNIVPGMFFHVDIVVGSERVLTLPKEAVMDSENGPFVYAIKLDKAVKTPVTTGNYSQDSVEVTSGLKPGQPVALSGAAFLKNGEKIAVVSQ